METFANVIAHFWVLAHEVVVLSQVKDNFCCPLLVICRMLVDQVQQEIFCLTVVRMVQIYEFYNERFSLQGDIRVKGEWEFDEAFILEEINEIF